MTLPPLYSDRDNYTFMKFPPENQLKSIFEYAAFYFAQVADGLASLRGKLQLEILPAELLEVLERCRYGEKEVKFSRIFTSNIPVSPSVSDCRDAADCIG
jgi:hypothetical protein